MIRVSFHDQGTGERLWFEDMAVVPSVGHEIVFPSGREATVGRVRWELSQDAALDGTNVVVDVSTPV